MCMTEELKKLGLNAGHRRIGWLVHETGIRSQRSKTYKVTTDSNHAFNIAPYLLIRNVFVDPLIHCSHNDRNLPRQQSVKASMGGAANCSDNSTVETFFKTIEAKLIWQRSWLTRRDHHPPLHQWRLQPLRKAFSILLDKPRHPLTESNPNEHSRRQKNRQT